jgi:short-subunit dehydrogenase
VPPTLPPPRSILITGATSGIGAALARLYAGPGVTLALSGRNAGRLEAMAGECRGRGATVKVATVDVTHRAAMAAFVDAADAASPLDLVIANAGISAGFRDPADLDRHVRAIFATNVEGVFNTVHPALPGMIRRGQGQIAVMSSLAGFRGLAGAAAYAASKAAVRSYGEGLRGKLKSHGVRVSVICPGYVRTPMTDSNRYAMPFLMDAEKAARIIHRGLARDRGRIAFPWPMYLGAWLLAALPDRLVDRFAHLAPEKA